MAGFDDLYRGRSALVTGSCYFHDAATTLLRDGQLTAAAAEEERFTLRD